MNIKDFFDFSDLNKTAKAKGKGKDSKKKDPDAKVRNRGTVCCPADSPKVKDDKDHFPINDEAQARNALARVNQYSKAPPWWSGSLQELVNAVTKKVKSKYKGIEVSEKSKKPGKDGGKKKAARNFIEILKKAGDWEADPRAVPTIAKSIYNKFKDQGFSNENIMSLASELLGLVTQNIRGEDEEKIPPLAAKVIHTLKKMAGDEDLVGLLETPLEEESPETQPVPELSEEERYEQHQAKQDMANYLAEKLNMDPNILLNLLQEAPSFNITSDIAKSVADKINILTKLKVDGPEVYGNVIDSLNKKCEKTLDERIVLAILAE